MAAAHAALQGILPKRFAARWLDLHPPQAWTNLDLAGARRHEIAHNWTIRPAGTEGYEKAEVTSGGVDTDELSSKTMESTTRSPACSSLAKLLMSQDISAVSTSSGHGPPAPPQVGRFSFLWHQHLSLQRFYIALQVQLNPHRRE